MERKFKVVFENKIVEIQCKYKKKYYGEHIGKLYIIKTNLNINMNCVHIDTINSNNIWHTRFGHANPKEISILKLSFTNKVCDEYVKNKSTKKTILQINHPQLKQISELIHTDMDQ